MISDMRHVVALALSEHVPIFELAAPCAIFGTDRSEITGTDWYTFKVCSPPGTPVDRWFRAATPHTYADLVTADTVIVPACHDESLTPPDDLVCAVRDAARRGARVASICTGAFVLGAAGLLDGRRAATHWLHASTLAARHPAIDVDEASIYVDDGDILTSAGKSAGMDLCLHIVRRDYGAAVANHIARRLVTPPHREGHQRQYIDPVSGTTGTDAISDTMSWAVEHLDQPLSVRQLAQHAHVSVRTIHRQFVSHTGSKPLEWLNTQRVRRAQSLLETSDRTIERIASDCGFGTSAALRRQFHSLLGTNPDTYRRMFSTTG